MLQVKKLISSITGRPETSGPSRRDVRKLRKLVGMTVRNEREYVEKYARQIYSGQGEIVDLGSWLGALTICLLEGLKKNPLAGEGRGVHAYDLFEWADWMRDSFKDESGAESRLKPGDSFLPDFVRRVWPHDTQRRLLIHAGDLTRLGWGGQPIELLIVDVMKSWGLANAVVRDFFPFLMPGKSYVLHQDFCHYFTPWIHLTHYRLRDHFEKVASLPGAGTVVFKYTKPFPTGKLPSYSFADFDDEEVEAAFAFSLKQVEENHLPSRQMVLAAKVMVYVHKNEHGRARRELDAIAASGVPIKGDLAEAAALIQAS